MKRTLVSIGIVLLLAFIILIIIGNRYVNDETVPVTELAQSGDRVLFVFAHPDDEIMVAGTAAGLNAKDIPTGIVYLTRGENGPTGGLVSQEKLGEERTKEVYSIKDILGLDYLKVFDYPDSHVEDVDTSKIKASLLACIQEFKPTVIVGFDETVGLYGHEDHRLAGLYLHEVLKETAPFNLKAYYMVTLPQPMIDLALKMSSIFRERYPKDPARGLPKADLAVNMWKCGSSKKKVLKAHKTQWEVIEDVQPYGMTIPSFLYYGIFDREYFHKVDLD